MEELVDALAEAADDHLAVDAQAAAVQHIEAGGGGLMAEHEVTGHVHLVVGIRFIGALGERAAAGLADDQGAIGVGIVAGDAAVAIIGVAIRPGRIGVAIAAGGEGDRRLRRIAGDRIGAGTDLRAGPIEGLVAEEQVTGDVLHGIEVGEGSNLARTDIGVAAVDLAAGKVVAARTRGVRQVLRANVQVAGDLVDAARLVQFSGAGIPDRLALGRVYRAAIETIGAGAAEPQIKVVGRHLPTVLEHGTGAGGPDQ